MRFINAIKYRIWKFFHAIRCKKYRRQFTNKDVSIISMNCTGGILYHNLGLPFLSPTINLYLRAEDFIKFCEKLDYYLSIDKMEECYDSNIIEDRKYPVAKLGDIYPCLVHYKSIKEAEKKWNERKKRINFQKLVIINTDREGMTSELMDRFERLPYKKVMFTHNETNRGRDFVYIPGYENEREVGIITDPQGWLGLRPIDNFNWINFLNQI